MAAPAPIVAAGAVVVRKAPGKGLQVLLVHRPKYDDWSFPKGKLDPHEHVTSAAVREVAEETGLHIRLGPPLTTHSYPVDNGRARTKQVHYWLGRPIGEDDVTSYPPNDEIDRVRWVGVERAPRRLSYEHDVQTLEEALTLARRSQPLVLLRHGKARARGSWRGDDHERPLTPAGELQSDQLVPVLAAYGVRRVVSSTSRRCWTSVAPYAEVAGIDVAMTAELSEQDATRGGVDALVAHLLAAKEPALLCSHRPVLPLVFEALGLPGCPLEPAALAVVHHRRGKVVTVEVHAPPAAP